MAGNGRRLADIRKFSANEDYDGYLQDLLDYIGGRRAYLLDQGGDWF